MTSSTPRYLQHTESSSNLVNFMNEDQDVVRHSFGSGSFTHLRTRIPDRLKHDFAIPAKKERASKLYTEGDTSPKGSGRRGSKPAAFSQYEYIPSSYDLAQKARFEARQAAKRRELAHTFSYRKTNDAPKSAPAFSKFSYAPDMYIDTHELLRSSRLNSLIAAGIEPPNSPPTGTRSPRMSIASLGTLGTASPRPATSATMRSAMSSPFKMGLNREKTGVKVVANVVTRDWGPNVSVKVSKQGAVVVYFSRDAMLTANLTAYMNRLIDHNDDLCRIPMRRDASRWGIGKRDGVQFVMMSPVVRQRQHDTFFKLHPEHSQHHAAPQSPDVQYTASPISLRVPFPRQTASGQLYLDSKSPRVDSTATSSAPGLFDWK
eukprot:TRINITY_DN15718_c0_g1_i1.p1 TRINITY_DN15718_c0_g1~~TRINITY_DN15718_c0_g1_i1.p1  ORF type:complete len:375 (+),score=43.30 TRINITY_DN15718_c0_g1_i1:74-1198(+)